MVRRRKVKESTKSLSKIESKILKEIKLSSDVLKLLHSYSRSPGGFGGNKVRQVAWKILADCYDVIPRYRIHSKRVDEVAIEEQQVQCDIDRSLWSHNVTSAWKDIYREKRRKVLSDIVLSVLVRNPHLYYYQGFHDVASIFMLVLEDTTLTQDVLELVCLNHLSDYMNTDFKLVCKSMKLVFMIIRLVDEELYNFFLMAEFEPYFVTSWLITWFSHEVKSVSKLARMFDALLCSHPLFCHYLCAAYVISLREHVLRCECDFGALHNFLVHAPQHHEMAFEKLLSHADELFALLPFETLIRRHGGDDLVKILDGNQMRVLFRRDFVIPPAPVDTAVLWKYMANPEVFQIVTSTASLRSWKALIAGPLHRIGLLDLLTQPGELQNKAKERARYMIGTVICSAALVGVAAFAYSKVIRR